MEKEALKPRECPKPKPSKVPKPPEVNCYTSSGELENKRFGNLVVGLDVSNRYADYTHRYLCVCDCGNEIVVKARSLSAGRITMCGVCAAKKGTLWK